MRTSATNIVCASAHARLTEHFLKPRAHGQDTDRYNGEALWSPQWRLVYVFLFTLATVIGFVVSKERIFFEVELCRSCLFSHFVVLQ